MHAIRAALTTSPNRGSIQPGQPGRDQSAILAVPENIIRNVEPVLTNVE
jgi:hypothetical protein